MRSIKFITGNEYKFKIGHDAALRFGIKLAQKKLDTPEIQSTDISEISMYSARWAAEKLNEPIVVSDVGYYFRGLNGFPGPFVKFTNKWFTADDYLRLMNGVSNRAVDGMECIAYCEPNQPPAAFIKTWSGTIAHKKGKPGRTPMSEIFIEDWCDKVRSEIPEEELTGFLIKSGEHWGKLAEYLSKREIAGK